MPVTAKTLGGGMIALRKKAVHFFFFFIHQQRLIKLSVHIPAPHSLHAFDSR